MVAGDGAIDRADDRQMLQRIDDVEQVVEGEIPVLMTVLSAVAVRCRRPAAAARNWRLSMLIDAHIQSKQPVPARKCRTIAGISWAERTG